MLPFPNVLLPILAAGVVSGALRLLARWRAWLLPLALPAGLLAGAVTLTLPFNLRALWAPRVVADHLQLVALAGLAAAWATGRVRRRWVVPLGLAFVTGWWVAHSPPALPEFWRAGLVVTVYALVLARSPVPAVLAAAGAGVVACLLAGAAPVWREALLVPVAACAAVLGTTVPAGGAAAFVAAAAALMSLAGGRVASGRVTVVDGAALVPLVVALAWPPLVRRFGRVRGGARPKGRVAVRRRRA